MASQGGNSDAGCSSRGISHELRATDLPSKRLLGKGLVSIVYETEWNGERFARKDFIGVPNVSFQKEASILVGLEDHENVVKTHGWTADKLSCSLVLEYVEEDLLDWLQKKKDSQKRLAGIGSGNQSERNHAYPFKLAEALDIVLQLARGMNFLHERNISHGDLKTRNILVTHVKDGDKKILKVADFGLARTKSKSMSFVSRQARKLDMVQWQAPEILERILLEDNDETSSESDSDLDKEGADPPRSTDWYNADVYSFAVTCSQILTGEDPYPNRNWKELGRKIVSGELRPKFPARFPPLLKHFLESCWRKVPAERPTFSYILKMLDLLHVPEIVDLMERQLLSEDWMRPELHRTPLEKWLRVLLEVNPHEKYLLVPRLDRNHGLWNIEIQPPEFMEKLWFGSYKVEELGRAVDAINYYEKLDPPYIWSDSPLIFFSKELEGIQFRDLKSCEQYIQVGDETKLVLPCFTNQVSTAIHSATQEHNEPVSSRRTSFSSWPGEPSQSPSVSDFDSEVYYRTSRGSKGMPETMAPENRCGNGTGMKAPEYMAAQPKLSKKHFRLALASFIRHGQPNVVSATFDKMNQMTWQQKLSMNFVAILWWTNNYLTFWGLLIEWSLNLLLLNDGILSLLYKVFLFKWGEVVTPQQGTECYLSLIGQLDWRSMLFVDPYKAGTEAFPGENMGARSTADVCIMAAKLAYENICVVKKVVEQDWYMHFVKFYNCWNEYQEMRNTQAFVFMDKATDANAVVVSFRGTEPFNAYDWSTDLDFSWVKLEGLGGVHLGFLEALGLATRDSIDTFVKMRNNAIATKQQTEETEQWEAMASPTVPPWPYHKSKQEIINTKATSGLPADVIADDSKLLAYDDITKQVALLLHDNPKAKLFITGHSLGGALAALYATMLHYTGQTEIASKIGAVYTFGQPRVGDKDFADYASERLAGRYFRFVYCNDVVPRFPFDNNLFTFKHFGNCDYFNSVYDGFRLREEPNPNFYGVGRSVTMHLNAVWELVQGVVLIAAQHGDGFRENSLGIVARVAGVFLPEIAAHNPCNYVNSVRLGPLPLTERLTGDIADMAQELHLMQDNVMDILYVVSSALPAPGHRRPHFAAQRLRR